MNCTSVILSILLLATSAFAAETEIQTIPLFFEANHGQANSSARFVARGHGYNLLLAPGRTQLVLRHSGPGMSVTANVVGANPNARIHGEQQQPGRVNYLRGGSSLRDIPTFARVRYDQLYPGIDVVYYGNQSQLEYDFVVQPGAQPEFIKLSFDGVEPLSLDAHGNLILRAGDAEITQHKPVVYQERHGSKKEIEGRFRILSANTVGFEIGDYDHHARLVIDPILTYSTFIGGSNGDDDGRAIAIDAAGNVYVTGSTTSTNFQTVAPIQGANGNPDPDDDASDVFVVKISASGTQLLYSTYLGGNNDDDANGITVDSSGSVTIVGSTASPSDFPTTPGAIRRLCNAATNGSCLDAFVAKLNPSGSALTFSTYLGGTGDDEARAVAGDAAGGVYVAGKTSSTNFPISAGAFSSDPTTGGFVAKLSPTGTLVYGTYFGAGSGTTEVRAIAVDSAGSAYVTGSTPASASTGTDVFVTKLNTAGSAALYSQFIRGAKDDAGNAITIDTAGNAYVTGQTFSLNFSTNAGLVQSTYGGGPAFRSDNAGATWSVKSTGINRSSLQAIAVAGTTPATIYAGADDETAGGIFRSTDGGTSWTSVATSLPDARVHALAVDPSTPSTVYAGTRTTGVVKSTTSGASWTPTALTTVFVTALAIDPLAPATVYAGTSTDGIFKTANGGASWIAINNGLLSLGVHSIAIHPTVTSTLYAATSGGIYKSTDGGASWFFASSGLFDPDVNVIVIDPRNPNLLYAGTASVGVFRSLNGGTFWLSANGGLTSSSLGILVTAMTIDPASGTLYAATGESDVSTLYKSSSGTTWTSAGLATARLNSIAIDTTTPNVLYAATVGGSDAFVAKWDPSGALIYATYLGGYRDDAGKGIALDAGGNLYITGDTSSANFPLANPLQTSFGGGSDVVTDAFVAKLNPTATAVSFSTYLGGASNDFGRGIAVDATGNAYITGATGSNDFPTAASLTATRPGLMDAFVAKIADSSTISYSIVVRGGFSTSTQGGTTAINTGYARVQPTSAGAPSGVAIFSFRQNGVLVSEAAVNASSLITSGRINAEVGNGVDTGLAIANPNSQTITLTFYFTDSAGVNSPTSTTTIPPNSQIAKFLTQAPFNSGPAVSGTFTFTASAPVAAVALRGLTNERPEFLITTLPIADLAAPPVTDILLFPHYAEGGGWSTQIVLLNPGDAAISGAVDFSQAVNIAGQTGTNFPYTIPPRSSRTLRTSGTAAVVQSGSVKLTPAAGSRTPIGLGIFSFRKNNITVSEAGVPAIRAGAAFRLYAEASGFFSTQQVGSAQTGVAIVNAGSTTATVNFELTRLNGTSTGLTGVVNIPPNGQVAKFLSQISGFEGVQAPFQGVLRVSSTSSPAGIAVVGLRGRYNERGDFLITTTQPSDESVPAPTTEQFFPHFADGGGYTTQFILFNGSTDQFSSGSLRFFNQSGQSLSLSVR
jgi:beta-propeller repeat-containing protein